jgi:hypothetical protein
VRDLVDHHRHHLAERPEARARSARACAQLEANVGSAVVVVPAHADGSPAHVLAQVLDAPPTRSENWVGVHFHARQKLPGRLNGGTIDTVVAKRIERHEPPDVVMARRLQRVDTSYVMCRRGNHRRSGSRQESPFCVRCKPVHLYRSDGSRNLRRTCGGKLLIIPASASHAVVCAAAARSSARREEKCVGVISFILFVCECGGPLLGGRWRAQRCRHHVRTP